VALLKNPKEEQTIVISKGTANHVFGGRNPLTDRYKILHAECRPGLNRACHSGEDRLRGFGVARGRILALPLFLQLNTEINVFG